MKTYLIVTLCMFLIGTLFNIINLGRGVYPRRRDPIDAWVDVVTMFFQLSIALWGISILYQLY